MATYSQVERNGLFELTEETRAELASSSFYNEDLAPSSVAERKWTTYNITMLWVGMSICIPALSLSSGLIGMGVSPWLAVLNVALGNLIVLIPIQLNSNVGTKYGIPFPLFARLTFGPRGAHIPAILRGITACGWTSVQSWVGGGAVGALIGCIIPKFADKDWIFNIPSWGGMTPVMISQFVGYVIFILFVGWVAYNGMEKIKLIQSLGGPVLIIVMLALLLWSYSLVHGQIGFWEVMNMPSDNKLIQTYGGWSYVFLSGLMGNIAFWATMALNIPDFSRYARSQKDQYIGQLIGMPLPMAFCAFVGAYYAQASKVAFGEAMFDPTLVLYYLDNKIIVAISALGVVAATVTTCVAANVVAPANGFSNVYPKKVSYKMGVIITICIAFFILQAWWIYGSGSAYFTWMNAYGTILAPLAGIFIADYWIVKKQRVDVADLFRGIEGRYWYSGGFNWAAVISWFCAFILPLLMYFGVSGSFWTFINSINYFWSFTIGFLMHIILMKTFFAGKSFVSEEEHETLTQRI
ncbi:MAG: NCS1 family nucleobase:cation symporter-1 [Lentihominibacter sp.]